VHSRAGRGGGAVNWTTDAKQFAHAGGDPEPLRGATSIPPRAGLGALREVISGSRSRTGTGLRYSVNFIRAASQKASALVAKHLRLLQRFILTCQVNFAQGTQTCVARLGGTRGWRSWPGVPLSTSKSGRRSDVAPSLPTRQISSSNSRKHLFTPVNVPEAMP
jgi:hypothetical protein